MEQCTNTIYLSAFVVDEVNVSLNQLKSFAQFSLNCIYPKPTESYSSSLHHITNL